ncbi:MAG: MFS transporter [Solirubrobacterales bacterium]|nr:MFS transporter [Solirubrobacterales bacterium]
MVVLDATIVNVALPSIQSDLDLSGEELQWIINSYTLMFGGFLLLGGRAADLLGRRTLFVAGVALFSFASLLDALATDGTMLILARGLQGLGGALVSPAALSIITTTFAEGEERTKALGVWGAIAGAGGAFGLLLGGILTDLLAWEWIFLVNVPIGLGVAAAAMRFVPNTRAETAERRFDLTGAVTVTAGLVVLVYAIVKAEAHGWGSLHTLGLGGLALALLGAFVATELRAPAPLVRLDLFRIRTLATANGVFLIVAGGLFAMFFFASLYVQQILGYSPLQAGFAFLPVTLGIMSGAALSQQLIKRVGVRTTVLGGMSLAAAGLVVLAATTKIDGSYLGILVGLFPMAVGMGSTFVPLTLVATTGVADEDAGLASGVFNTAQQVGGALGLAILATLANDRTASFLAGLGGRPTPADQSAALVEGFQLAFTVSAGLIAVGVVLLAVLLRRRDVARIDMTEPVLVGA